MTPSDTSEHTMDIDKSGLIKVGPKGNEYIDCSAYISESNAFSQSNAFLRSKGEEDDSIGIEKKTGDIVTLKRDAVYINGIPVPARYIGVPLTVSAENNGVLLLREICSWVDKSEINYEI